METFMDPFMKVFIIVFILKKLTLIDFLKIRPSKYSKVQEFRKVLAYIRTLGKEKILERISELTNNELTPNDILSSILEALSNIKFYFYMK